MSLFENEEIGDVIVLTKPNCPACEATKTFFKNNNIAFEEQNIYDKLPFVASLGFNSAPVVTVTVKSGNNVHWSGFDKDKLVDLQVALSA